MQIRCLHQGLALGKPYFNIAFGSGNLESQLLTRILVWGRTGNRVLTETNFQLAIVKSFITQASCNFQLRFFRRFLDTSRSMGRVDHIFCTFIIGPLSQCGFLYFPISSFFLSLTIANRLCECPLCGTFLPFTSAQSFGVAGQKSYLIHSLDAIQNGEWGQETAPTAMYSLRGNPGQLVLITVFESPRCNQNSRVDF